MGACCESHALKIKHSKQRSTLTKVLWINVVMFVAILLAAFFSRSIALFSESLDYFGDALTYALSLFAVTKGITTKAQVALFKGVLIFLAACFVIVQIIYRMIHPMPPIFEIMVISSVIGMLANGVCLVLLWKHKSEDINMSSVFECSKNDIASNLSVLLAAIGVWVFDSGIPDIVIALLLVAILLHSATRVIRGSLVELGRL